MPTLTKDLVKKIRRIQLQSNRLAQDLLAGAYHSAFKGQGMEFDDVREYQPGDDVRTIDWNVTARMDHPYVKSFKEERELTVLLAVDVSASTLFGSTHESKNELIAEIGAVLAFSAIRNNDKIGLVLFSDKIEKYITPKKGLRHVLRIIRELLIFKPADSKTDINQALQFLNKVQKRTAICFLLSDFMAPVDKRPLALLAKHHDLILLRLTDPWERELPKGYFISARDLETGKEYLVDSSDEKIRNTYKEEGQRSRSHLNSIVNQIGGQLIDLHTDQPYLLELQKFFKVRKMKKI